MKTIIVHSIISSNTIYKLTEFIHSHKQELGEVLVLFYAKSQSNRKWTLRENISFEYEILPEIKFEHRGKDLLTYTINPGLWKRLNAYDADRVIISGWSQYAYHLAFLWAKVNKKRITLWSGSTQYERTFLRHITAPIVRTIIWHCDDYIAYGSRAAEYLQMNGADKDSIEIFLNDVNKEYFKNQATQLKDQSKRLKKKFAIPFKTTFLYVGQFIQRKGILDLLQAFSDSKASEHNAGLLLIGYGNQKNEIARSIKTNSIRNVKMLDFVDQYDLPPYYAVCDYLILPSFQEVWGLVANEALYSNKKTIIRTSCGCYPDLKQRYPDRVIGFNSVQELTQIVGTIAQKNGQ